MKHYLFGSNIIYNINDKDQVEARYDIDFGQNNLDKKIPSNFETLSEFKESIDFNYYHSISGFYETDEWIYFRFFNKNHFYNVYFSKPLKKSFISKPYPRVKGRIAPWVINGFYEDKFISFMEPILLNQDIENLNPTNLTSYESEILHFFNQKIEPTNNPILLICTMKNYKNMN